MRSGSPGVEEREVHVMAELPMRGPIGRVVTPGRGSIGWFVANLVAARRAMPEGRLICEMNHRTFRTFTRALATATGKAWQRGKIERDPDGSVGSMLGVPIHVRPGAQAVLYRVVARTP